MEPHPASRSVRTSLGRTNQFQEPSYMPSYGNCPPYNPFVSPEFEPVVRRNYGYVDPFWSKPTRAS